MKALKNYLNSFSPLEEKTWEKVEVLFSKNSLKRGEYFTREARVETEIGFLEQGIMRAFYRSCDGTEYNKHFFVPFTFVGGYASLVTGCPNQILQQALTDCNLFTANYHTLSDLFDTCRDLEKASRRIAELQFVRKEQREIEIVLLEAEKRYRIFQKQYPDLEQTIPQYHIASYLGITPTQLSRIRKKLLKN